MVPLILGNSHIPAVEGAQSWRVTCGDCKKLLRVPCLASVGLFWDSTQQGAYVHNT